jgi:hypothetical protein
MITVAGKESITISGTPYNIILTFPLEAGYLLRMEIQDQSGKTIQRIDKPLSAYSRNVVSNLRPFIPLIKEVIFGK